MFNPLRIVHFEPMTETRVGGSIDDLSLFDENIENITYDEQRMDEFMRTVYSQLNFWFNKGYKATRLIVSLKDYRNLLVYESKSSLEKFRDLEVIVDYNYALLDGQKNFFPTVLPSNKDILNYEFFKQKEKRALNNASSRY